MEKKSSGGEEDRIIHDFNSSSSKAATGKVNVNMQSKKPPIILFVILLVLGIGTGWLGSQAFGSSTIKMIGSDGKIKTMTAQKGQVYGSKDEKTFRDSAEGVMKTGGIEGEGAYHLERPGGESQNVYLTSSVIDLSQFVGKKVKVWGETNAAQKAGWLMDVGRLQLL